ncbi:hypothetical protein BV898_06116 [Hypsibius exemplaris]|uniref:Uncharacterized protein n=1 Tax=Hypsibius exemplaris TaxID=2072580 RepID=A0A1W0WXG3_HYPEX|nr:hypothetical protein BV898_06116 [Hypsibius exemplaris]
MLEIGRRRRRYCDFFNDLAQQKRKFAPAETKIRAFGDFVEKTALKEFILRRKNGGGIFPEDFEACYKCVNECTLEFCRCCCFEKAREDLELLKTSLVVVEYCTGIL